MAPKHSSAKELKILLLTGRSAAKIVRQNAPAAIDIHILPIDIAAFISLPFIKKHLPKSLAQNYDLIMVPGLVQGDVASLSDFFGVPFVKGPRYASDIRMTLREINPFTLSTISPADKFLKKQRFSQLQEILRKGFQKELEPDKGEFVLGFKNPFPVGIARPPLIMAEIVDATTLPKEKIIERALYYLRNGAEILDIGAVANNPQPERIPSIITLLEGLRNDYSFAISIDTLNEKEILAAIDAGVELILSVDHGNFDAVVSAIPTNVAVVFLPTNVREGQIPRKPKARIKSLLQLKEQLLEVGITKLVADPIIEMPIYPGFSSSLEYYIAYRKADPRTPMMTCIGNVTEFIAADPIGINALFGCIAVELGIQLLLVTDVSVKCRGGIKEITKARNLAYVAKQMNKPPKGLGISLLMAKSRTANDLELTMEEQKKLFFLPAEKEFSLYTDQFIPDPKGSFKIWVDYHKQQIYVHHLAFKTNAPTLTLASDKARPLFEEIMKRKLVSTIDHAYYLGRELERAEICLYLGKTYIQDEQVFQDITLASPSKK